MNNCIRYLFSAAASGFVLPMIVRSPSLLPLGLLTGDKTATCWRRLDEYARGSAVLGWVWVCSAVYQVWGEDEGGGGEVGGDGGGGGGGEGERADAGCGVGGGKDEGGSRR